MAGKNTIQILRGSITGSNADEKLLEGQPFYNEDKNYLTIGRQGGTASLDSLPITVRELVGYHGDSTKITAGTVNKYSVEYIAGTTDTDTGTINGSLNITSPTGININSGASNITIKRNNNPKIVVEESNIELDVNSLTVKPNTDNIATISTSSSNGFAFKDNNTRKANVEMGSLTISSRTEANASFLKTDIGEGLVDTTKIKSQQYVPIVTISSGVRKSVINISNLETDNKDLHIAPAGSTITNYVFNSSASLVGDGTIVASIFKNASGSIKISESETILKNLNIGTNKETVIDDSGNITTKSFTASGEIKSSTISCTGEAEVGNFTCTQLQIEDGRTVINSTGEVNASSLYIADDTGNTHVVDIYGGTGNIRSEGIITAQSFNALSDKRLKENIVEYSPNKSILDLHIYSYNFISDEKKTKKIGCLAQDLKEICPEIVKEDDKGYLSIEENKIVYLLLDEVKKLKKRVDELEAR